MEKQLNMTKSKLKMKILYKSILFWVGLSVLSCQESKTEPITYLEAPTSANSSEPSLHLSEKGTLYLSWTETDSLKNTLKFSTLTETDTWSKATTIAEGDNWFVNWADFPSLTTFGDNIAAHYLVKSANDTYTYDVTMKVSNNNGETWNDAFIPHKDGTNSEHGFVSKVAINNDVFFGTWLDGRQYAYAEADSTITKEMTLRGAMIMDNNAVVEEFLLDDRVCDCCQTDTAMTNDGPIVVYRDRSEDEIRDIYYVKMKDDTWTDPNPVFNDGWRIEGCPVNGPAISANGNQVAVAWFSAANNKSEVKVVFSNDSGNNFSAPIKVDYNRPLGRVDIESIDQESALVTWLDSKEEETVILAQKIHSNGTKSLPFVIAKSSESRSSGFPRIVINEKMLFATWTDVSSDVSQIRTVKVDLDNIK